MLGRIRVPSEPVVLLKSLPVLVRRGGLLLARINRLGGGLDRLKSEKLEKLVPGDVNLKFALELGSLSVEFLDEFFGSFWVQES